MPNDPGSRIAESIAPMRVPPGKKVELARDYDPADTGEFVRRKDAKTLLEQGIGMLAHYQSRLAAQDTYGVLMALQALDAGGKDSTIKHVMSGVNPQGVSVHGFRKPSAEELDHDFLWRYALKLPPRGHITIFNRSHYEEVLVVRVHQEILQGQKLPPAAKGKDAWQLRYRQINDWERYLVENGISVLKVFLNLSKEEQRCRFLRRIDYPEKNWKFNAHDVDERQSWDDYQKAFSQMLSNTSTEWAPWYVVPADHKWFARLAVAAILVDTLVRIDPQYPTLPKEDRDALLVSKAQLEKEAPEGAAADPIAEKIAAGKKS